MPKLAIILTDEYADWEFAPIAAISKQFFDYKIHIASPNAAPVRSIAGLLSTPEHKLEDVKAEDFDALVIIGGNIWEGDNYIDMKAYLDDFLSHNKPVAGICGATLALARAGLLNSRKHTSNEADYIDQYVKDYGGHKLYVETNEAVADKNVISASGFSPHQFAAQIFRALGMAEDDVVDYLDSLGAEFK